MTETSITVDVKSIPVLFPKYAGGWHLGGVNGITFMVSTKPSWIARKMMSWFFEWEWRDNEQVD